MLKPSLWSALLLAAVVSAAPSVPAWAQPALEEPAYEAEAATGMATIAVVGVKGYDELMGDIGYLGALGGQPQAAQMIDGMIALFTQGKGIVGLDKTKPAGVVVQTDGAQFAQLACLPINDLPAILDLLVNFQVQSEDLGGGVYELTTPDQIIYAKQIGDWVVAGMTEGSLEAAPADPSKFLTPLVKDYDLGARVLVQNVPPMFKQMAIGQLQAGFEAGLEQLDDETDEAFAKRREVAELQIQQIIDLINDLNELTVGWNVDRDAETTRLDLSMTAVPGTNLAAQCAALENCTTSFSGFASEKASLLMRASGKTPADQIEAQREQLQASLSQAKEQALSELDKNNEIPNERVRETVKGVIDDLFEAIEATAMAGETDGALVAIVSPTRLTVIGGATIAKASKVEDALRKLDTLAKEEAGDEFPGVQWNAAEHAGASFHKLTIPLPPNAPPQAEELFGSQIVMGIGIGDDVAYFAMGKGSVKALFAAIDASAAAGEVSVTPVEMVVSLKDIMETIAAFDESENAATTAMVADLLAGAEGKDKVRLTVSAIESGVRYRLEADKGVLEAIGGAATAVQQSRMQGGGF